MAKDVKRLISEKSNISAINRKDASSLKVRTAHLQIATKGCWWAVAKCENLNQRAQRKYVSDITNGNGNCNIFFVVQLLLKHKIDLLFDSATPTPLLHHHFINTKPTHTWIKLCQCYCSEQIQGQKAPSQAREMAQWLTAQALLVSSTHRVIHNCL